MARKQRIALSSEAKEQILQMLIDGAKASEIGKKIGCATITVYKVAEKNNLNLVSKRNCEVCKEDLLNELRRGEPVKRLSAKYGVSAEYVRRLRDGAGLEVFTGNQYGDYDERLEHAKQMIAERTPWYEYVGGFTTVDGFVDLRCKKCGTLKHLRMSDVRARHGCGECMRIHWQTRRDELEAIKQQEAEHNRMLRLISKSQQLTFSFCECGAPIDNARAKRCRDCTRKMQNKNREMKRRVKLQRMWVDSDITPMNAYRKFDGVCWLCGGLCDPQDWEEKDGTIICSNNYPSVDHVIPLSKGGAHAWKNVKLAHRICNSVKGDSMPPG